MKFIQSTYDVLSPFCRTKWKRQTAVGFELLAEAGNLAAVQNMCRGMGTFPWVPGYPPPHPATAHAAATASLFSSPALQQQLDMYYRQVAATQAAAAAQALHQPKGPSSPNDNVPSNVISPLQIPSPAHLHQPNLHYKLMPSILPIVSTPSSPLSPSKSVKGISDQSSPIPQNHEGPSPSPPSSAPALIPSQVLSAHLPLSNISGLEAPKLSQTCLRPGTTIMPNIIGPPSSTSNGASKVSSSTMDENGTSPKAKHRLTPPTNFSVKVKHN